jgi:hypothetical protein
VNYRFLAVFNHLLFSCLLLGTPALSALAKAMPAPTAQSKAAQPEVAQPEIAESNTSLLASAPSNAASSATAEALNLAGLPQSTETIPQLLNVGHQPDQVEIAKQPNAAVNSPVDLLAVQLPQVQAANQTVKLQPSKAGEPISSVASTQPEVASTSAADLSANPMGQVTSVSQLSDVKPTDWAYQALQSLVERYGCIVGYPDRTYRGQRALTRYEFAAGLNACLDRISELVSSSTADLATKEDLATLQRLQEEFAAELTALRGRVDALDTRVAELEANQFSTTTKLAGEVIFSLAQGWGAYRGSDRPNTTPAILSFTDGARGRDTQTAFNYRLRLNLLTSFTGNDVLITGLQVYNFLGDPNSIQGTLGYSDVLGLNSSQVRLGYEPQFPGTNPQNLSSLSPNTARLYKLLYIFPVVKNLTFFVGSNAETSDAFPAISPFASDTQGALSRFAGYNPVVRVSGGTSGTGLASAAGFIWTPLKWLDIRALYGNVNAAFPNNVPLTVGSFTSGTATPLGAGLFSGSMVAATQVTLKPASSLSIGLNYAYSYHQINILGTGLTSGDIGSVLFNPADPNRCTAVGAETAGGGFGCSTTAGGAVNRGATLVAIGSEPIHLNSVGGTATWFFLKNLALTASGALIFADLVNVNASTTFSSWMVGLYARDLFGQGNSAGLIFGKPLSRVDVGGRALAITENATPLQLEGYINFRITDNINVTPGAFAIFNPEGYSGNPTAVVAAIRTSFTF